MTDDPWKSMARRFQTAGRYAQMADDGFETQLIKQLGQSLSLDLRPVYASHEAATGDAPRLRWEHFRDIFPTFPILLGSVCIPDLHKAKGMGMDFFRLFATSPLIDAYDRLYSELETEAGGRVIGLVSRYQGCRGGLIVHDAAEPFCDGPCWRLASRSGDVETVTWVESFPRVVQQIAAAGWTP